MTLSICFVSSNSVPSQRLYKELTKKYPHTSSDEADVIVALGGDGFMLETLHIFMTQNKPVYGINCGTIGFLMNTVTPDHLIERIERAKEVCIHPLQMTAHTMKSETKVALAINEVSLLRSSRQAANLKIFVDGIERLENLVCDGALICTSAGSSAYNLSAHGPILPIDSQLLALTPISPFRPRRWRGALLSHESNVSFQVLDSQKRPVSAVADFTQINDINHVHIRENHDLNVRILFDNENQLQERIINEQFSA